MAVGELLSPEFDSSRRKAVGGVIWQAANVKHGNPQPEFEWPVELVEAVEIVETPVDEAGEEVKIEISKYGSEPGEDTATLAQNITAYAIQEITENEPDWFDPTKIKPLGVCYYCFPEFPDGVLDSSVTVIFRLNCDLAGVEKVYSLLRKDDDTWEVTQMNTSPDGHYVITFWTCSVDWDVNWSIVALYN